MNHAIGLDHFNHVWRPGAPGSPTLLMLHGTGGNEESLVEVGQTLAPGAGVLSPRGQVLENGSPRFFRRFAEGLLDLDDLRARVHELADWLAIAASQYEFSPESLVAVGYSNGANVASSLLILRPESICAFAAWRPMAPLEVPPGTDLQGKSALLISGEIDPICSPTDGATLRDRLAAQGADAQFLQLEGVGHGLSRADVRLTSDWLLRLA